MKYDLFCTKLLFLLSILLLTGCINNSTGTIMPAPTVVPRSPVLFVTNNSATAARCYVNNAGNITGCSNFTLDGISHINQIVRLNSTTADILDYESNIIFMCNYESDSRLSNCQPQYFGDSQYNLMMSSMVINTDSNVAYILSIDNSYVSQCGMVESAVINCPSYVGQYFNDVTQIALNNSMNMAYLVNENATIDECVLSGGAFNYCSLYTQTPPGGNVESGFEEPYGMANNTTDTVMYLTDLESNNNLWICSLNELGNIISCAPHYDGSLSEDYLEGIVVNHNNTTVYIAGSSMSTNHGFIATCGLSESGGIMNCESYHMPNFPNAANLTLFN